MYVAFVIKLLYIICNMYYSLANESLICHEQCDSMSDCWGPSDTQCDGCRNFRYLRHCIQNCSVVSLPANSRSEEGCVCRCMVIKCEKNRHSVLHSTIDFIRPLAYISTPSPLYHRFYTILSVLLTSFH